MQKMVRFFSYFAAIFPSVLLRQSSVTLYRGIWVARQLGFWVVYYVITLRWFTCHVLSVEPDVEQAESETPKKKKKKNKAE